MYLAVTDWPFVARAYSAIMKVVLNKRLVCVIPSLLVNKETERKYFGSKRWKILLKLSFVNQRHNTKFGKIKQF